jgi:hypothetical protein
MKTNNKNKSALVHHVPRIAPKRLFSLQLFIVIAIAIPCSLLVLFPGPRTDIVIWAAAFWMLIVGAGAALTIFDQPDKPRGPISWHGWGDSMTVGGDGGGGC